MKRKTFAIVFSLVLVIGLMISGCSKDKEIASVNGMEITTEEFKFWLYNAKNEIEVEAAAKGEAIEKIWETDKTVELAKEKALEAAIFNKVQLIKAKELGVSLDQAERDALTAQKDQYINTVGRETFNKELAKAGLTEESYTKLLEEYRLTDKLSNKIISESDEYTVSQQQIETYYENNKQQFENIQVTAKHILFSIIDNVTREPLPEQEQEEARKKAEEIYARLKAGEDFDKLMNEYSEDPGLAEYPDGYTFGTGKMVPEFEVAAFSLEPGEMSEIVKSDFGYHILKIEDKQVDYYSLEETEDFIRQTLLREKYYKQIELWRGEMKIDTNDEIIEQFKMPVNQ